MPDLQEFSVVRQTATNVNIPSYRISGKLTDSETGAVLADFTDANALAWPSVLSTLTVAQQDQIAGGIAQQLLSMKAGL